MKQKMKIKLLLIIIIFCFVSLIAGKPTKVLADRVDYYVCGTGNCNEMGPYYGHFWCDNEGWCSICDNYACSSTYWSCGSCSVSCGGGQQYCSNKDNPCGGDCGGGGWYSCNTQPCNTAPNTPTLSSPINIPNPYTDFTTYGRTLNLKPKLVWNIPSDAQNNNLHFKVYYDTSSGNTLVANSATSQIGFEYYNGSSWLAYPSGGVTSAMYGRQARYKPQTNLTSAGTRYSWKIIANDGSLDSTASNIFNFVVGGRTWTDTTITANSTLIRKIHVDELRQEIDFARKSRNITGYSWTDSTITANSTLIRAVHFTDLRTALSNVVSVSGESNPSWSESITANSTLIRKTHLDELRTNLTGI